ncbi:hypothetical protein ACFVXG_09590 [Kitasatospora sp. NPDC058162]|uniref:hypothetical protein n=1 Tax=Kitasatospora sp. NPDC058162 TaxID=3346362 RepID=UPI0036D8042D
MSRPRNPRDSGGDDPASAASRTELLLRAALAARADEVGVHDLRPAAPPARTARRSRRLRTTALPLIGLAAAGLVGYFALDHPMLTGDRTVRPAVPVTSSPTPSPTAPTPTPSASASASPTGTPDTTPSAPASPPPATDAPTTDVPTTDVPTTSPPAGANATSGQYVAATWLKASELPLNPVFHWQAAAGTPTNRTGDFQWLWVCGKGSPTGELQSTSISLLDFNATRNGASTPRAAQLMFYFKDADAAATALDRIRQDYAGCAADRAAHGPVDTTGATYDWQITRTASSTAGFAYRTVARGAGNKPAEMSNWPPDSQEWFARSGNVITMVSVSGFDASVDPTGDAARTLDAMTTRLGGFPR